MECFVIALLITMSGCATTAVDKLNSFVKVEMHAEYSRRNYRTKTCEIAELTRQGSGTIIKRNIVLTAGHVCDDFDVKVVKLIVIDKKGNRFPATIRKLNLIDDLCLLDVLNIPFKVAIHIRRSSLVYGEEINNLAAPKGFSAPTYTPYFKGRYCGYNKKQSMFCMPAAGGSSGSAIFDHDWRIVGVVSMVLAEFHHLTISPSLSVIQEFLKDDMPVPESVYNSFGTTKH